MLHVRYIVVHEAYYLQAERTAMLLRVSARSDVRPIARFEGGVGAAHLFELR